MSLTGTDYRRYDPRRVCDVCGHLWHKSELKRIAPFRWACPDDFAGLTAEDISRHNANVRPLTVRAVKNAKGLASTPTFQQAEGVVLNAILDKAPDFAFLAEGGVIAGTAQTSITGQDGARAAGFMALYLGNLVLENRRPRRWIEQATTKLISLCDSIVAMQFRLTATDQYLVANQTRTSLGAFYRDAPFNIGSFTLALDVTGSGVCLLALLRAYQATGLTRYIVAARTAATFLRRAQCVGLFNTSYASVQARRMQPGPFPTLVTYDFNQDENANVFSYTFRPSGIICAWALDLLRRIDGDATYGDATAIGDFGFATAAGLSSAVSQCTSWWRDGEPNVSGAPVIGFSSATPRAYFTALVNGSVGAWSVENGASGAMIESFHHAFGIRALWEIGGFTDQVADVYTWLRGFSANPANAAQSDREREEKSTLGTYDPTLALARYLQVANLAGAAVATEAVDVTPGVGSAPGYDWRTVGILAPIQSSREQGDFRVSKDVMSAMRHRRWQLRDPSSSANTNTATAQYVRSDLNDDLRLLTFSGLSLQTSVGMQRPGWTGVQFGHYIDLEGAAIASDAYRYAPQAFPLEQG